jgi:hypothetical protein
MSQGVRDGDRLAAILVLVAGLAFAVSPFFSTGFNGFAPDQFPIPQNDPPIQPAGYAFSIWGIIYIWLLIHAATGLFQRAEDPEWRAMRWPLTVSLGVGASWIAVAQTSPVAATAQIWLMLIAALVALYRSPRVDRWRAQEPIALYAGWLTAASFVSIGLIGAGHGILFGATGWGFAALAATLVFALTVQTTLARAPAYGGAVIWALIGIAVANGTSAPLMTAAALAGAGLMAVAAWRCRT